MGYNNMVQTWNNLLDYIKVKLGVPTNLFEFSDDFIQNYIKNNVLPHLSSYVSWKCWIALKSENLITDENDPDYDPLLTKVKYRIPVPANYDILDVKDLYLNTANIGIGAISYGYMLLDPRDTVMGNTYENMIKSLSAVTDYEFMRPDILILGRDITEDVIIECRVVHQELKTIPSDFYHEIFKKRCLGEVMLLCAAQRSKYADLSTQFGPIPINWEKMENDGKEILQEVDSLLDAIPPEYLIAWID